MDAFFGFQVAVGVFAVDLEGYGFDACFVAVQIVQDFYGEAFALGPSGVHAVEHAGPVAAFGSAGPCVQLQDGVVAVVFSGQEGFDFHGLQFVYEGVQFALYLRDEGGVAFFVAHFNEGFDVLVLLTQVFVVFGLVFQIFKLPHAFLGFFGVVPVAGGFHFTF